MKDIYKTKHWVEDRLNTLHTIKNLDDLSTKARDWTEKAKSKRVRTKEKDRSDVKTDLSLIVKLTKDAELLAWFQEYEFMPLDDRARKNINLFKPIWYYRWMTARTDKVLSKVIPSSTTYWTWIMYEWLKTIKKEIQEPSYDDDGNLVFKTKVVDEYNWVYNEWIPFENFYIDWDDIDNANEAIWIKYWDRDEYMNSYKLSSYSISDIPRYKDYTVVQDNDTQKYEQKNEDVIMEIKYYNVSKDKYIVLANGVEVYCSPIPYKHKELPFCLFYDYKVEWRIYGMWEFELLEEEEVFKDKLRSLTVDIIKAQMWTILLEDDLDIENWIIEYWTNTYTRVDNINGVKHFSPAINSNIVDIAETRLDNDVIAKTWIDIRQQYYVPWETAKKTDSKNESVRKKINLNLKINWFDFFERLARLRVSNIKLIMSNGNKKIPVKGIDITDKLVEQPLNGWYGFFTVKPEYVEGNFNLIPIVDSLTWENKSRARQEALAFDQIIGNIVWDDGKPVVSWKRRLELLADIYEVDYEKLTSRVASEQSPEDIMREMQNNIQWVSNDTLNPSNPDYIPPEQRSWATKMLSWMNLDV